MRSLALLACALLLSALPADAQKRRAEQPRRGGTLVIGAASDLQLMNSLVNAEGRTEDVINTLVFMPLVRLAPNLDVAPYLARSWQNAGDSILTFRLRRDVRWHDGRPTTAYDVAFTLERALDSLTAYPDAETLSAWRQVQVIDSFTVKLSGRPHRDPLLGLLDLAIMPKHLLDSIPAARLRQAGFNKNPVGNGPFRFVSQRANDRWVFEANESFPRELGGRPYLDRLVWRVIPENSAQLTELRTGGVDIISPRAEQLKELDAHPQFRAFAKPSRDIAIITWNTKRPPLDQAMVRRALALGLNRERMVTLLRAGYAQPAASPVPPTHWAYDPAVRPLPYDTVQARRLLAQAGFADRNGDGILEHADGKPLEIELQVAANNAFNRDVGEMVRSDLARIGVRIVPRPLDFATLLGNITGPQKNFDGAYLRFVTEMQLNLSDAFHTKGVGGALNSSSYSNPRMDALLDRVDAARTRAAARPIWSQIQRMLRDEQPWAFLWHSPELYVINERVRGSMDLRAAWTELPRWWLTDAGRQP